MHQKLMEMANGIQKEEPFKKFFNKVQHTAKENMKKYNMKQSRHEIKQGPIKVAYGWDSMNGYFLSVFDERLECKKYACEEANNISEKIGVGDCGGSYFDLHTGENGYGFKVSNETLAEFIMRYGAPTLHIESIRAGKDFARIASDNA